MKYKNSHHWKKFSAVIVECLEDEIRGGTTRRGRGSVHRTYKSDVNFMLNSRRTKTVTPLASFLSQRHSLSLSTEKNLLIKLTDFVAQLIDRNFLVHRQILTSTSSQGFYHGEMHIVNTNPFGFVVWLTAVPTSSSPLPFPIQPKNRSILHRRG